MGLKTPTYVGSAVATGNSASFNLSLTSLTGGVDTAAREGDLVLVADAFVQTSDGNPGVSTAGFVEIADLYSNDTRDCNLSVSWKVMGASPDTTVSCNGSGSATNGAAAVAHVWRYVNEYVPFDPTSTTATGIDSAVPNPASITPTLDTTVVIAGAGTGASVDNTVTVPTNYTNQRNTSVDPGNAIVLAMASRGSRTGGVAEDPPAWTGWTTSTSDSWCAVTMALRPQQALPFVETFNRADSASLGNDWLELVGTWNISSNGLALTAAAPGVALATGVERAANVRCKVTVKGDFTFAIYARYRNNTAGADNIYAVRDTAGNVAIVETTSAASPTETTLASASGVTATNGDVFALQVAGPYVAFFKNGALVCSNTSGAAATITTAGWCGVYGATTSAAFDQFEVEAASVTATVAVTEGGDTCAATATITDPAISATVNVTEAADTSAATAALTVAATAGVTEVADTSAATAALTVAATAGVTEAADTLAATAALTVAATVGVAEAADTPAATAALTVAATVGVAEAADTSAATLEITDPSVLATVNVTEAADTLAATAALTVAATAGIAEAADTLAATAALTVAATVGVTEAADTLAATAALAITAVADDDQDIGFEPDIDEEDDSVLATATLAIAATAGVTEAADAPAATAALAIAAVAAVMEGGDTCSAFMNTGAPIEANVSVVEADDSCSATATAPQPAQPVSDAGRAGGQVRRRRVVRRPPLTLEDPLYVPLVHEIRASVTIREEDDVCVATAEEPRTSKQRRATIAMLLMH